MTNAIFSSGGITEIGSLRNIQLKRNGKTVARLDLYDLLLRGDTSGDARLLPGDVIFVPPVSKTASITGAVKRPAIYELKIINAGDQLIIGDSLDQVTDSITLVGHVKRPESIAPSRSRQYSPIRV